MWMKWLMKQSGIQRWDRERDEKKGVRKEKEMVELWETRDRSPMGYKEGSFLELRVCVCSGSTGGIVEKKRNWSVWFSEANVLWVESFLFVGYGWAASWLCWRRVCMSGMGGWISNDRVMDCVIVIERWSYKYVPQVMMSWRRGSRRHRNSIVMS